MVDVSASGTGSRMVLPTGSGRPVWRRNAGVRDDVPVIAGRAIRCLHSLDDAEPLVHRREVRVERLLARHTAVRALPDTGRCTGGVSLIAHPPASGEAIVPTRDSTHERERK